MIPSRLEWKRWIGLDPPARTLDSKGSLHRPGRLILFVAVVYLYALPVVLPALGCYFDLDDAGNLHYHRFARPPSEAITRTILFFLPYRRPVGGCLYLLLYSLFGFTDPLPYYVTGLAIYAVNVALLFWLVLRLTGSVPVAILAGSIAGIHGALKDIWYNFGTVYDQLAFAFLMAGFHFYLSFLSEKRGKRWGFYAACFASYVLAVGSKEIAVTLPAILAAYAWVFRGDGKGVWARLLGPCVPLIPFLAVAAILSISRVATNPWDSPLFVYHFDATVIDNLSRYLEWLFYHSFSLSRWQVAASLVASLGAGLFLRNRPMVFGWLFFLISLTPVLPLPRISGFFLFIPMAGFGLFAAALLAEAGARMWRLLCREAPSLSEFSAPAAALALLLCLGGLVWIHHERVILDAHRSFKVPGALHKRFDRQLFAMYPTFPTGTALLVLRNPYNDWALHQTIQLHYGMPESDLPVWAEPNLDLETFCNVARQAPEYHVFDYEDGRLVELGGPGEASFAGSKR